MPKLITGTAVLVLLLVLLTVPCLATGPLSGKIIVLDPGHGGSNDGAIANGVREADVNLAVSLMLRDRLASVGATVVMTRTEDRDVAAPFASGPVELQARVDFAAAYNADIFVSIHANSVPREETAGAISFYATGRSNELARAIQTGLFYEIGLNDKGVRPANFYVLRYSPVPAALIEVGFLTNRAEAALLASSKYQQQLADGIFKGILSYYFSR